MTSIAEEFVLLRGGASTSPVGDQLLTRQVAHNIGRRCLVAVDSDGHKHLLVEIGEEKGAVDTSSRGVTLTPRLLFMDGESVRFADLHCHAPALDLVFERLVEDVLKRLSEAGGDSPGAICRTTLAEWRALLQTAVQPLTREQITGIAGELEVLRALAERDPAAAVTAWRGPDGWSHDFASRGDELEVKATTSVDGNFIQISNIMQLDPADCDSLHLVVIHFRENLTGQTLDERIRELLEMGVPADVLLRKVSDSGYVFESEADVGMRLTVRSMRVWHVSGDFPGLRQSELVHRLNGVSKVRYELALDSAPRPLGRDETERFIATWLQGADDGQEAKS